MKTKRTTHNPTAVELDERFSLYGLDPEDVGKALVHTASKKDEPKPKRSRKT